MVAAIKTILRNKGNSSNDLLVAGNVILFFHSRTVYYLCIDFLEKTRNKMEKKLSQVLFFSSFLTAFHIQQEIMNGLCSSCAFIFLPLLSMP